MDCAKIREILGFYLDAELDSMESALVDQHLAQCVYCRAELASMRTLLGAAGEIEEIKPPAYLRSAIARATTQAPTRERVAHVGFGDWIRGMSSPARLRWAAGAAAIAVIGFSLILNSPNEPNITRQYNGQRPEVSRNAPVTAKVTPSEPIGHAVEKRIRMQVAMVATVHHTKHRVIERRATVLASARVTKKTLAKLAAKPALHLKPAADVGPEDASIDESAEVASAEPEKSEPTVKPVAQTTPDALSEIRPKLVKLASAPLVSQRDTEEYIKQIKATAAVRKTSSGSLTIISTRF